MYATTRYNFVRLKATHKFSPLEELVGGDLPPSSSQRLTGMGMKALIEAHFNMKRLKMYFGQRFHTPMKLQKNALDS